MRYLIAAALLAPCFCLTSCFEETAAEIENIDEELRLIKVDAERLNRLYEKEGLRLEKYKQAAADKIRSVELKKEITATQTALGELIEKVEDSYGEVEFNRAKYEKFTRAYRVKARKAIVGKVVDLSETMGADYSKAKVMSVTPVGIKIYTRGGPKMISYDGLPEHLQETLQMSSTEAAEYQARISESAEERESQYKQWKKNLRTQTTDRAKDAVTQRLAEIRAQIESTQNGITERERAIRDLLAKAASWDRKSAAASGGAAKRRASNYSLTFREQAEALQDQIREGGRFINRLMEEKIDLKKIQNSQ